MDNVMQPDGTIGRKLVCVKLKDVAFDREHRTRKSVETFVDEILASVNGGTLDPRSTMLVSDFVEQVYLTKYVDKELRPASRKQYHDVWDYYLKPRVDRLGLMLRNFRTVHGQEILDQVAEHTKACRSSLKHSKSFLSGAFSEAKRKGYLDSINPITGVRVPKKAGPEHETYAYNLAEIKQMLGVLAEPARTVILTASLTGLRKSELLGLQWEDFKGNELRIERSIWNGHIGEPKTKASKAGIPAIKPLVVALEAHRSRIGRLAVGPIFQAGNGSPLNLDNLVKRTIIPALSVCGVCRKSESEHKPEGHVYERNTVLPRWHGWHSFRRGLATNLHALGADDHTVQAILRHDDISTTQRAYIKTVAQSSVKAMDLLGAEFENESVNNELAKKQAGRLM
jgi:integrase